VQGEAGFMNIALKPLFQGREFHRRAVLPKSHISCAESSETRPAPSVNIPEAQLII